MIVWIIGLSGAGKTTIGRLLTERIRAERPSTVFLDGDEFREIMGDDLGYSMEDRRRNADRICRFGRLLDRQGLNGVVSVLSLFPESRRWNRENLGRYFEVYLDVPMEVLVARDPKGLYRRARAGEIRDVAGVDLPFPAPESPDAVVRNDGRRPPEEIAEEIFARIRRDLA